ncbi:MAG: hypothetical protein JO112_07600 [Planctomycetes bacterium]|nr:hypothetical protein [Planctomycetota bacterium]
MKRRVGLSLAAGWTAWSVLALGSAAAQPPGMRDIRKGRIESPTKTILARQSSNARPAVSETANPKVEPGKVHWHATFPEACAASARSGKPVLLFQMMGKLDDQFC